MPVWGVGSGGRLRLDMGWGVGVGVGFVGAEGGWARDWLGLLEEEHCGIAAKLSSTFSFQC